MAEEGREEETWGSCEVVGAISEGTRRTSGPRSRYGDPVGNQMPRLLHCCTPIASRVTFALLPSLLFLISSFLPKQIFPSPPREKNTILFLSAVIRLRLIGGGFINGEEREEKNLREMTYRYSGKEEKEERFFVNFFLSSFLFEKKEIVYETYPPCTIRNPRPPNRRTSRGCPLSARLRNGDFSDLR